MYVIDLAYSNATSKNVNGKDILVPIDWSQIIPLDGVITKVSELNFTDETFIPNWHGIGARGFARAGYHYFRNNQLLFGSGSQARTFASAILAQGFKPSDYFVCDNEEKDGKGNPIVSLSQSLDWFYNVKELLGLPDYSHFWLYSTADILNGLNTSKLTSAQLDILHQIYIWIAGYPNLVPTGDILTSLPASYLADPSIYGKTIGWQYQENAAVPSIPGGTDLNEIDAAFLKSWQGAQTPVVSTPTSIPVVTLPVPFTITFTGNVDSSGKISILNTEVQ